jgi:hypothetical protein
MRASDFFLRTDTVLAVLGMGILVASVAFLAIGARSAESGVLGALVGAALGLFSTVSFAGWAGRGLFVAAIWAGVGAFLFGLMGLLWKAGAARFTLKRLAAITAIVGVLAVLAVPVAAVPVCDDGHRHRRPPGCLDTSEDGDPSIDGRLLQVVVAFDAAYLALLFLLQAGQTQRPRRKEEADQ